MEGSGEMTNKRSSVLLLITATASGFCNALLGAGGGIILSFALGRIFNNNSHDKREVLINAQAAMIIGCAVSCFVYATNGNLDTTSFSVFALPAAIGGALGSLLLFKIDAKWIARLFSLLIIWSGIRMVIG